MLKSRQRLAEEKPNPKISHREVLLHGDGEGWEETEEERDDCAFFPVVMSRRAFCLLLSPTLRRYCVFVFTALGAY